MRQYNVVQPLWMAFYAKSLYRDVHQHWRKFVYIYLLFLVTVCALPLGVKLFSTAQLFVRNMQPWIEQLPTITLKDGEVSIDKPEPFYIKYPGTDQIAVVIDTKGDIATLEESKATFLLTRTRLLTWESTGVVKAYDLSKFHRNYTLDKDTAHRVLPKLALVILLIFPFGVGLYFLQGLLEASFYAFLAKLFIKTPLPYKEVYRLGVVALTPKFVLVTLLGVVGITFPYKWILYFALGLGYLLYAIEANRN